MEFEKPPEPDPKDFGLTEEKIRVLEKSSLEKILERVLSSRLFWALYVFLILLGGIIIYIITDSLIITLITLFFGWGFPLFIGIFLFGIIGVPIEIIYRHFQPDYQKLKNYKKAKEEYKKKLFLQWIRIQKAGWKELPKETRKIIEKYGEFLDQYFGEIQRKAQEEETQALKILKEAEKAKEKGNLEAYKNLIIKYSENSLSLFPLLHPASKLPYPKEKIKEALKKALSKIKDKQIMTALLTVLITLEEFIPDNEIPKDREEEVREYKKITRKAKKEIENLLKSIS